LERLPPGRLSKLAQLQNAAIVAQSMRPVVVQSSPTAKRNPRMNLIESITSRAPELAALRRDLHAHPELSFAEFRTSDLVAEKLTAWGIPIHRGLGRTGVVGIVKNGTSARAIGLRADMDALPMQEANDFAHASRHAGRMHACGHDGHTAMLLAAAQQLAHQRDFDGTVYLIFQPAEEGAGGARQMIEDGLFERFPMEAVFGMHNSPGLAAGKFAVKGGPAMASSSDFAVTLHGKGGHAAFPHRAADPLPVACQLVLGYQTVVSRDKDPGEAAVLSVTMIHTGDATNIIPDRCVIKGTVRTFSSDVLDLIEKRMREMTTHTAAAFNCRSEFVFERDYPPTINTPYHAEFARQVMTGIVGADNAGAHAPVMGSEDFAYMLQARPGAYVLIGNGDGGHRDAGHGGGPCEVHNPSYDFNDSLIPLGASYWVRLAEQWLGHVPPPSAG
jgi:amidohydrolase